MGLITQNRYRALEARTRAQSNAALQRQAGTYVAPEVAIANTTARAATHYREAGQRVPTQQEMLRRRVTNLRSQLMDVSASIAMLPAGAMLVEYDATMRALDSATRALRNLDDACKMLNRNQ